MGYKEHIKNANDVHAERMSGVDKLASTITNGVSSIYFFLCIALWSISWLSWNTIAPSSARFDPAPGFILWLFISNLIQISLMPLILIGQNLASRHSEIRAELDYQIDMKAEQEITALKTQVVDIRETTIATTVLVRKLYENKNSIVGLEKSVQEKFDSIEETVLGIESSIVELSSRMDRLYSVLPKPVSAAKPRPPVKKEIPRD